MPSSNMVKLSIIKNINISQTVEHLNWSKNCRFRLIKFSDVFFMRARMSEKLIEDISFRLTIN